MTAESSRSQKVCSATVGISLRLFIFLGIVISRVLEFHFFNPDY